LWPLNLSEVVALVKVGIPRSAMGTIRLHDVRANKYYYVDVYLDETIGDVKALLHKKHNINVNDGGRLLISLPLSAEVPDNEILFNLDLSKVYSMIFSRTFGIAPRARPKQESPIVVSDEESDDPPDFADKVANLISMGFTAAGARTTLRKFNHNSKDSITRQWQS
jgi:hypothetical protein